MEGMRLKRLLDSPNGLRIQHILLYFFTVDIIIMINAIEIHANARKLNIAVPFECLIIPTLLFYVQDVFNCFN